MRTLDLIIKKENCVFGAPMGRPNVGNVLDQMGKKIYDSAVPMVHGCYDKGGAYWGLGKQVRVMYTKDLQYIFFYRTDFNY